MATNVTLYAWAVPAFFEDAPVDHTWVTTYDNTQKQNQYPTIQQVIDANQEYWFCWGDYHETGGTPDNPTGALGNQSGNLALAQCLVAPNLDSRYNWNARGTIFYYGIDGVCHQLANQVLYATSTSGSPLTVQEARGYYYTSFIYGTYGHNWDPNTWPNKIAQCGGPPPTVAAAVGGAAVTLPPDDFEKRAHAVLGDNPQLLGQLLALRGQVHQFAAQKWPGPVAPSAETLNARNQHMIDQAAALLGPEKFTQLFGFPPGRKVTTVDPNIYSSQPGPKISR
jgi:hypothetical protein